MMLSDHLAEKIPFSSLKEATCRYCQVVQVETWDLRAGAVFRIGTGWRSEHTVGTHGTSRKHWWGA